MELPLLAVAAIDAVALVEVTAGNAGSTLNPMVLTTTVNDNIQLDMIASKSKTINSPSLC